MVLNPRASPGPFFPGQAPGNGTIPSRPPSPSPEASAAGESEREGGFNINN